MGSTMGCGAVSSRVNRHFSRHGKLGPQEGRELGLVYTIQKAPADNGTLRRATTSDEGKGRPCWRFHCLAWWSNSQENMQINYLQRLTRKLRLVLFSVGDERCAYWPHLMCGSTGSAAAPATSLMFATSASLVSSSKPLYENSKVTWFMFISLCRRGKSAWKASSLKLNPARGSV
jgi:hypothetical protein